MVRQRLIDADALGTVGTRRVRASVAATNDEALRLLPGVVSLTRHGMAVTLESGDADATVRALFASGVEVRDVEVTGVALEDAFVALTETASHHQPKPADQRSAI